MHSTPKGAAENGNAWKDAINDEIFNAQLQSWEQEGVIKKEPTGDPLRAAMAINNAA